ncbi:MAG: shikimate kinase [Candidatus Cryptobacteroides sp.]
MIVSLSGFMGCGKSSIGKTLQQYLNGFDFIDLDEFIENMTGKTISDIFSESGEENFRYIEFKALKKIFAQYSDASRKLILAIGGGTLVNQASADIIANNTIRIYLRASQATLEENLMEESGRRPMLQGADLKDRIAELMLQRAGIYENRADHIIDTDGRTYSESADEIIAALNLR